MCERIIVNKKEEGMDKHMVLFFLKLLQAGGVLSNRDVQNVMAVVRAIPEDIPLFEAICLVEDKIKQKENKHG